MGSLREDENHGSIKITWVPVLIVALVSCGVLGLLIETHDRGIATDKGWSESSISDVALIGQGLNSIEELEKVTGAETSKEPVVNVFQDVLEYMNADMSRNVDRQYENMYSDVYESHKDQVGLNQVVYVDEQLALLGKLVMKYLELDSFPGEMSTKCDDCVKTPYYMNPLCAKVCLKEEDNQTHQDACWMCTHWSVKLDGKVSSEEDLILQLPVMDSVLRLSSRVLGDPPRDLSAMQPFEHSGSHIVQSIKRRLDLKSRNIVDTGGGGGMGIQFICSKKLLLSIGGGGGQGMSGSKHKISFGGGQGAGFQVFNENGTKIASYGGGGGGGEAIHPTGTSKQFGSSMDEPRSFVSKQTLENIRNKLLNCWKEGRLSVVGGGGMGGGYSKAHVPYTRQSVSFSFALFKRPCPVKCLSDKDWVKIAISRTSHSNSQNDCKYVEVFEKTKNCANICAGKPYHVCMCPCFKKGFRAGNCSWAARIDC
mmetsp:Transcript_9888/g.18630  ORF Transcript_9888/g.18630 Transcript_9888/m.18630 type:complete len:481 (-) Transcript_9888:36-1478(-)